MECSMNWKVSPERCVSLPRPNYAASQGRAEDPSFRLKSAYAKDEAAAGRGMRRVQKLRVPRWCWVHSSRPVARVRPSLNLLRSLPCGLPTCDLRSGSGLTANRKNLPNASELYPAFDVSSCSPRPALCYRPLLALPIHLHEAGDCA
jgi:hypothetical protein